MIQTRITERCRYMRRFFGLFALLCLLATASAGQANRDGPGHAGIASAHPLATKAGFEILGKGGNAFDAAVAVSAALSVVEQYSSGLGGGGFYLLYDASENSYVVIDGREKAPAAAYRDMYLDASGRPVPRMSRDGPIAAAIPGVPASLVHLAGKYGTLPLETLLEPAIRYAREGFPVDKRMHRGLEAKEALIARWPAAREVYLPGGVVPEVGTIIRQPDLARTLEALVTKGRDGFYEGEIAKKLVDGVRDAGGVWTEQDLRDYSVIEREALIGEYHGMRVVSVPPPSSGGVALINILNILAGFDLDTGDRAEQIHVIVEAMRRAYRDRAEYLGDPDFVDVPVEVFVHPFYAAGQRAGIRNDRITPSQSLPGVSTSSYGGMDTSHFSIIDADGNRVAGTQTVNFWFGSGFMAPGTGVLLNNEMDDFSVKPGVPNGYELIGGEANSIRPNKRPLSSMTPTFLESDRGVAVLGTPGGSRIISMVLLDALAWHAGATAEEMVSLPRYHHQYIPDQITVEPAALSVEERSALQELGHQFRDHNGYGNMQVVTWDYEDDEVAAASDPRGVGEGDVY
ncbi:MAG: gamma-glutamyltransferase [Gammaproteobacteria bacterium]